MFDVLHAHYFNRLKRQENLMGIPKKLAQLVGVTLAGYKATVRVDNIYTRCTVSLNI